jgi:hypothetical protein
MRVMQGPWLKRLNTEPVRSFIYLASLILLKIALQSAIVARGFMNVSADEFARGVRAAEWALQPRLDLFADVKDIWLPLEKYLNGVLLLVWPDVIGVPRLTVFIASCIVLVALFVLTYYLFDNFWVAALAAAFVVFQPWYVWLSGSPMLEMYFLACFLWGLVFLLVWLRDRRRGYWVWAGLCFMLASGFHVQSWTLINLACLLTLPLVYFFVRRKQLKQLLQLIGLYFLSNSLIITLTLVEFFDTGHLFGFLASHTSYSKWFYNGYDISVWEKLLYYPQLIVQNTSGVIWVVLLVALAFLLVDRADKWKWVPLSVAVLSLSVNSIMNVLSVPATAAPGRYSVLYVLLLAPYLAYGVLRLFTSARQQSSRLTAYTLAALAGLLFLFSIGWGIMRIPNFPPGMPISAIQTGYYLNHLIGQNESNDAANYMLELKYWDFLGVKLTAGHYTALVFDRVKDTFDRNTSSIFTGKPADVYINLMTQHVRYVALSDPTLKASAGSMDFLLPVQEVDDWMIYEFEPTPE